MNIVLLGSGNVATHLGRALKKAGENIIQVWSRTESNAQILADELEAEIASDLAIINPTADIYILAVKDDVIQEVGENLPPLQNGVLIHTSGSTEMNILKGLSSKIGVFYFPQTFSKIKPIDFKTTPIAVEGNLPEVVHLLKSIAERLSDKVIEISAFQRMNLHMAAVFACNFTNHLYHLAEEILKENQLDLDLLRPIILETAAKIQTNRPVEVQTGPAIRGDQKTINKHLELLENNPGILALYTKLSQSIAAAKADTIS